MKNENIIHQTIRFNRNDPSDMAILNIIDRLKRQGLIGSFNDAAKTALKEKYQQFPVKQPAHKNQPVSWIPRIIFRKGFLRHFHCAWAEYFLLIYNCLILL